MERSDPPLADPELRDLFAAVLTWGTRLGFLTLLVTFGLYIGGAVKPAVPLAEVSGYWGLSLEEYRKRTAALEAEQVTGWRWLPLL